VFCTYWTAPAALPLAAITSAPELKDHLSSGNNPVLTSDGKVAQKYLCPIPTPAATQIANLLSYQLEIDESTSSPLSSAARSIAATTVRAIVDARLGQGKFRSDLEKVFGGACPITNLNILPLLRASHIRPWSKSNNEERLDPENGILLAAGIDAAFDRGFIGFDCEDGSLLVKDSSVEQQLAYLGVPQNAGLPSRFLSNARRDYLREHQTNNKLARRHN
jgi:putative restriction endonuclease